MAPIPYANTLAALQANPATWLITGVAGFIGSNLLETLLRQGQRVVGLDNFSTGHRHNLSQVRELVGEAAWARFHFIEGDIRQGSDCVRACAGVDYVLHQAALGSVPRSIADPVTSNASNADGTLNMFVAARDAGVKRVVYASSSAVYGDHPDLPKQEDKVGRPLSPYAVTKAINELYADVFARQYGMQLIGLRYFNVFGQRQDPNGAYAAVIPRWMGELLAGQPSYINGDGETSRDFCYIDNVVQVNILAATSDNPAAINQVYNVAAGARTTLNQLFAMIRERLAADQPALAALPVQYRDFRPGDVRHSLADISKAQHLLGYQYSHDIGAGLDLAVDWYVKQLGPRG